MADQSIEPLKQLLESVLGRLAAIEGKVGIETTYVAPKSNRGTPAAPKVEVRDDADSVIAYRKHMTTKVTPLVQTLNDLGKDDPKMVEVAKAFEDACAGIGRIVEMASISKRPLGDGNAVSKALLPHLKPTQEAIGSIQKMRLSMGMNNHQRALMELLAALSWVVMDPGVTMSSPPNHVKETLGATEFWSNKIRREYKGKGHASEEIHINFCNQTKALILDLTTYTKEYFKLGLTFNVEDPICATLDEAAAVVDKTSTGAPADTPAPAPAAVPAPAPSGGLGALMGELASKRTAAGDSAATGLNKVTKEQQTWRKEFNASAAAPAPSQAAAPKPVKATTTAVVAAPAAKKYTPVCELDKVAKKWRVEHQTKETMPADRQHLTIEVTNVKEQVYVYKCSDVTIEIKNKLKTIVLDSCRKVNVVFDTAISSCEVVNCQRIQIQTLGRCPTMSIDKTDGCLVYLSAETMNETTFVTSKSSEMNVSWPDDASGEMMETPIPEQFQHSLKGGIITSSVSDLYH